MNMSQNSQDHSASLISLSFPVLFLSPDCDFQEDASFQCPYKAADTLDVDYKDMVAYGKRGCNICYIYSYAMVQTKLDRLYTNSRAQMASWSHHRGVDCFNHWGAPLFSNETQPIEFICDARDSTTKAAIDVLLETVFNKNNNNPIICQINGDTTQVSSLDRFPSGDTGSDKSFQKAKDWIAHCDINHSCREKESTMLPKRVIGVGGDRVYIHESLGETGAYACLSHCWGPKGNSILLRTTRDTLATFKDGIPWTSLSKTFQDAIMSCRKLGLQWIWIDSLCIVQDDPLDWQIESAKMASIYENSYLTLAATYATDSSVGLFTGPTCTDSSLKPTPLRLRFPNGTIAPIFCRIKLNHEHFSLLRRAWVYQERLLSPRILHFAGFELLWECSSVSADCECGSRKMAQTRSRDFLDNRDWRGIVQSYLDLELTYPSDIFPALSGLADRFIRRFGDAYVAGMWKSTLINDLIWRRKVVPRGHTKCLDWRAPSWSWASVAARSYSPNLRSFAFLDFDEPLAELLDARVILSGANPTGEVTSGFISVRAKAITVTLCLSEDKDEAIWISFDVGKASYTCRPYDLDLSRTEIHTFWKRNGYCDPECQHRIRYSGNYDNGKYRTVLEHRFDGLQFIPNITLLMIGKGVAHRKNSDKAGRVYREGREEQRFFLVLIESKVSPGDNERFGILKITELQDSGPDRDDSPDDTDDSMPEEKALEMFDQTLSMRRKRNTEIFKSFDAAPWKTFTVI